MQQLQLKPGIIDAADLPFTCKTGRLAVNKLSSATIHLQACIYCVAISLYPHTLPCVACLKEVHICWPWWKGLGVTVTVSGMSVTGKTRTLPKVSFALKQNSCGKSSMGADGRDYHSHAVAPCRLCNRMLLPAYSRKQLRL